ncbi:hypothetical protein C9374_009997 [Naegleria lovaniensis]|uniref:C2H2-type domain-containing protein n=1 Tax=Naegleria lovaniensis TaxID=51637 RepID=A0AA88GIT9_NAELO|nr:uncharacterized protein C9374_009997 [Naegleria lovaniensis]KAG2375374.1 hypothetical protein C9374_009997 [Naegleria lovaniensis]
MQTIFPPSSTTTTALTSNNLPIGNNTSSTTSSCSSLLHHPTTAVVAEPLSSTSTTTQQNIALISPPVGTSCSSSSSSTTTTVDAITRRRTLSSDHHTPQQQVQQRLLPQQQVQQHIHSASSSSSLHPSSSSSGSSSWSSNSSHYTQLDSPRNRHSKAQQSSLYNHHHFIHPQQNTTTINTFKTPLLETSKSGEPIHHQNYGQSSFQEEDQRALSVLPSPSASIHPSSSSSHHHLHSISSSSSVTMSSSGGSLMMQQPSAGAASATSTTPPQVTTSGRLSTHPSQQQQAFSPKASAVANTSFHTNPSSLTFPPSSNTSTPATTPMMNISSSHSPYTTASNNTSSGKSNLTNSMAPSGPTPSTTTTTATTTSSSSHPSVISSQQLQTKFSKTTTITVPSSNNAAEASIPNPPPTSSTTISNATSRRSNNTLIPALSSEPPTVKLPSIYALLTSNKDDPYLNSNNNQNSEIIYLRPIAKMVESSKRKQTCYAHFGNNIVKKQSSLRSKIRGIVGSRRAELFEQQKQQHSERGRSSSGGLPISSLGGGEPKDGTSSASHSHDALTEERLSENNISMDVMKNQGANTQSGSSDMDVNAMESDDPNQYMLNTALSGDDFGLTYEDMINFEDNEFMNIMEEDAIAPSLHHSSSVVDAFFASTSSHNQNMGLLGFNSSNNLNNGGSLTVSVSNTSLIDNPTRKGFGNSMKHETSSGSLSSFLNTPTTPLQPASFPTPNPPQKEGSSLQNLNNSSQSAQQNFWESSNINSNPFLNISLDNIPVSSNSGNFFVPSTQKLTSGNAGVTHSQSATPHYSSTTTAASANQNSMNSSASETISSSFNNMKRSLQNYEFVAATTDNTKTNQTTAPMVSTYEDFSTSNNMNVTMQNAPSRGSSVNTQQQQHQQHKLMEMNQMNHNYNQQNTASNSNMGLHLSQTMQSPTNSHSMQSPNNDTHSVGSIDTNNFFNISTDTLLQGILYAQKSGIDLASLFALTLQQQQKQASAYNESVSNSAGSFNFNPPPTQTQNQPFKSNVNNNTSLGSGKNNGVQHSNSSHFNSNFRFTSSQQGSIGGSHITGSNILGSSNTSNSFQSNKSFNNMNSSMSIDPSVLQRFIETSAASSPTSANLQQLSSSSRHQGTSSRSMEQQQFLMGSNVNSTGERNSMNFGSNATSQFVDQQQQHSSRLTSPTHAMIGGAVNPLFSKLHQQHQQQQQQNMNTNHHMMSMKNVNTAPSNASRKQKQFNFSNVTEENIHQAQAFTTSPLTPQKRKSKPKKDKQQQQHEISTENMTPVMHTHIVTSSAATEKGKTKRIKIKQDSGSALMMPSQSTFSSSQQHVSQTTDSHHHQAASQPVFHSQDEAAMETSPNVSDDEEGHHGEDSASDLHDDTPHSPTKKKRKSHITASQIGIIELENNEGFECSFCNRKFKRKSDIKVHIRRHTGERPYLCEIEGCGKAFTTASNLRRHNRNVHSKE